MKPPIEPKKEDCCNTGCNPCIFDVYEKQLQLYRSYIESGESANSDTENAMSQLEYKQFQVIDKINICEQHWMLLFKQEQSEVGKHVFWNPGDHFLIKYQSEKDTCSRAYTPIKLDLERDYDFAVVVKRYMNGQASNYLCGLPVGDCSLWRGPYGHYQFNCEKFCRLVMIAQGTGIAPLFSIIKHVLNNEENMTKIILIYCCRCTETIVLRDELYSLKSYWNFDYTIYLSNNADNSILKYKEPISKTRLTINDVLDLKPFTEKDQFLLCGSENFMTHYGESLQEYVPCVNIVKF